MERTFNFGYLYESVGYKNCPLFALFRAFLWLLSLWIFTRCSANSSWLPNSVLLPYGCMTSIFLADDHQILRHGLRALLEKEGGFEIVGEAEDGRQAVELVKKLKPDVIIMDLQMPVLNGIDATRKILANRPSSKVIFLSMSSDPPVVRRAIQTGARAFVLKDCAFGELVTAIRAVQRGEHFLGSRIVGVVLSDYVQQLGSRTDAPVAALTSREAEVLQLLSEGKSSKEIAGILEVSVKTIDSHRQNLMSKLDLHSIAELTKFAIKEGITSLDY